MKNNLMGYVTVENLPRPTRRRKWSSSATKATLSCHDWKREVGHNKFTSALSQIKGYLHRDLKLTTPKTVWSEFEVIMATSITVLTRSTLKQGICDKRCFIGYILQFSLPFLNLGNTSTSSYRAYIMNRTSEAQTDGQTDCKTAWLIMWSPYLDRNKYVIGYANLLSRDSRFSAWSMSGWNFAETSIFCKYGLVKLYATKNEIHSRNCE